MLQSSLVIVENEDEGGFFPILFAIKITKMRSKALPFFASSLFYNNDLRPVAALPCCVHPSTRPSH
jgi:hypothetical protein